MRSVLLMYQSGGLGAVSAGISEALVELLLFGVAMLLVNFAMRGYRAPARTLGATIPACTGL